MKLLLRAALPILAALHICGPATAHPGHGDAITRETAIQRASTEINRLADAGKLAKTWKVRAQLQTAELRDKGSGKEWALTFSDDAATDPKQRTLYVFLSETGEYIAANFSGQ